MEHINVLEIELINKSVNRLLPRNLDNSGFT